MPETDTESVAVAGVRTGEFHGALAKFCQAAYNDLVASGIGKTVAHVIGNDFGSDLGNLMKADAEFAAKVGKSNKEGETRIKITGRTAKGKVTNCMALVRIAQTLDSLRAEGLYSRMIDSERIVNEGVAEYLDNASKRAAQMTWAK